MINSTKILSENLTKNPKKTDDSKKYYHQNWAIFPEIQTENLSRWLKNIEETENLKQNANQKR